MAFHKVIGIDLGTTYSAVSVWDGKDAHVIESAFGARTVPSVVGLDPERNVIVGAPAQERLGKDPENTIIEVKREMGTYERKPRGAGDPGVPRRIRFRGRDYLPQEISAFILMELKRQAENYIGEPVHDAVITVPAYFKEPQRGATEDAARMARLNVRRLLNEPTAAAVCFGADKVEDRRTHTYAVYDLGGGTFDVSIIQVSPGNVGVVGTGGDPRLGGGDFDDRIVAYALKQIEAQYGVDLSADRAIRQRIKRQAEIRKRELSVANSTMLSLPYLTPNLDDVEIRLTRATFESLIRDLLERSFDCLDEAIRSAHDSNGVELEEIEQVLLVGGSTRIACLRSMLAERLDLDPRDIRGDISPEEVVARGAGLVARDCVAADAYEGTEIVIPTAGEDEERGPAEGNVVLQDVTSHTLGVLANQGDFVPILPKESRLPAEVTDDNFINGERFTEVDVLIYQGERPVAIENDLIGRLPIKLPEARERGYYRFAVTFALDVHGLLSVAVKCLNDGQIWKTHLQCDLRAGRDQIEQSARHLESVRAGSDDLPEPPRRAAPIAPPPDNVPDEYRRIASRAYELLGKQGMPERAELEASYTAFVAAVAAGSSDVTELGDELTDVFYRVKPR
jgi:molecular chaperone DnaK